ncbi:5186_t:CDS:2, partial [Racocetra persica]
PEPGGLLDPRIFGPFLNYECYCGKYKGKENRGQKCERLTNIAIFKMLATNLSKLLGIPAKKLEDIIYFQAYVVIDNGSISSLKKGEILEKKIDELKTSNILQEVIQEQKLAGDILAKAEELKEKITTKKNKKEERTTYTIFFEDYLDFLEKYCKVKISTGTEAFQELLAGID